MQAATGPVDLVCERYPDGHVRRTRAAAFLHRAMAEYAGRPVDLLWNGLPAHKGVFVEEVVAANMRLTLHHLPPCAPDLTSRGGVWCLVNHHPMGNHEIDDDVQLHATAAGHVDEVGDSQPVLRSRFEVPETAPSLAGAQ